MKKLVKKHSTIYSALATGCVYGFVIGVCTGSIALFRLTHTVVETRY